MAAQQKRMLTAPTSKLGKADLPKMLRKDDAWSTLPLDTRHQLYAMLPEPQAEEPPHDVEVNPLKTHYRQYLEEALRRFQEDLREGREAKKWRTEAMQASRDRVEGKFDEFRRLEREEYWGKGEVGNVKAEKESVGVDRTANGGHLTDQPSGGVRRDAIEADHAEDGNENQGVLNGGAGSPR